MSITPLNPYLAYKRDTSRLIFWIVRVSNIIIRTAKNLPEDAPKYPNTTGEVTAASLVALSKLIAWRLKSVPRSILSLFDSVIQARTQAFEAFQQISSSDPGVERSNASHKHFIDALVEAFEALGGAEWTKERDANAAREEKERESKAKSNASESRKYEEDELEEALFSNKFAALDIDDSDDDVESGSDADQGQEQAHKRRQQRRTGGKGKKGKGGGKKKKKTTHHPQPPRATTMGDIPVESYRITQDEEGKITDYLIAVYALFQEICSLRCYVQAQWRDVGYHNLNAAVAGALSNMAVNLVQRTTAAMFLDFPGHDSFENVLKAITLGDIGKVEGLFRVVVHAVAPGQEVDVDNVEQDLAGTTPLTEHKINIRELFLVHTYDTLVDFVLDYQKTRSGKPTKAMLQNIGSWDPNFNVRRASLQQRIKWRRSFTINWLYDLVNVFSSVVVQRNKETNNRYPLEDVDWSPDGPWEIYRRVYGLNEFAGFVTALAMQKQGTEIRSRIQPHHVFQLQCIVDSMAMSRGWLATGLFGHEFRDPPDNFDAQRDIKLFLDREEKRIGQGFLYPVDLLRNLMIKDGLMHNDRSRHEAHYELLKSVQADLNNALGRSYCFRPAIHVPPSRFEPNVNGMWDYCPYLCGVGLEEALRETYHRCLTVFDKISEPLLLLHLHNMLVQTGYLKNAITLFATLQELFPDALFSGGKAPTKKFGQALKTRISDWKIGHPKTKANEDFWTLRKNAFFRRNSLLLNLNAAGWNADRIPDADITMPSSLALHRVSQHKILTDPITGKKRMEDGEIIRRARKVFSEEELIESVLEVPRRREELRNKNIKGERSIIPAGYTSETLTKAGGRKMNLETSLLELLELVKLDLCNDICGTVPLSSLNFVWVMVRCIALFTQIEKTLSEKKNPLYLRAYKDVSAWSSKKRMGLTYLVLQSLDDEVMRIMASAFENPPALFLQHIYWEELELGEPEMHFLKRGGDDPYDTCSIM